MIYGFKQRFVPRILDGTKTGTIRAPRTGKMGHARPGSALQFKHGSRFRPVFFADTVCTSLLDVALLDMGRSNASVVVRGANEGAFIAALYPPHLDRFAVGDGFADWEDLCRFWWDTHRTRDFAGCWICWDPETVVPR